MSGYTTAELLAMAAELDAEADALEAARDALTCELCGEGDGPYDDVVTQLVKRTDDGVVIVQGHGQCGEDFGFELG